MELEELEPGWERVARLVGAATWSGTAGYLSGVFAAGDRSVELFLAQASIGPVLAVLFSLPRCAIASYLGRGFVAVVCFALGYASGLDHDPAFEETPALTFIVTSYLGWFWLLGGLLLLLVIKLVLRSSSGDREL